MSLHAEHEYPAPAALTVAGAALTGTCEHGRATAVLAWLPAPGAPACHPADLARLARDPGGGPMSVGAHILTAITARPATLGAACLIAFGPCRQSGGASMTTWHTAGALRRDARLRAEFLALARRLDGD